MNDVTRRRPVPDIILLSEHASRPTSRSHTHKSERAKRIGIGSLMTLAGVLPARVQRI